MSTSPQRPSRRTLKNDPDRRITDAVIRGQVWFPEKDILGADRKNLDWWIAELRKSEAMTRQLRKRLEALRDESERACPVCGRIIRGRRDAVYCEAACRIKAHRQAKRDGND